MYTNIYTNMIYTMPLKGWMNRSDSKNMNLRKGKVVVIFLKSCA